MEPFYQSTNINCIYCRHRWFWECDAFPKGIPTEILIGENPHTEPLPEQDNDIVFEQE
jgi:hypothetical protein